MSPIFTHLNRIASYKKRSLGVSESDLSLRDELTEMEKKLLRSQELVEIRGKVTSSLGIISWA